jgi:hypothetical protein
VDTYNSVFLRHGTQLIDELWELETCHAACCAEEQVDHEIDWRERKNVSMFLAAVSGSRIKMTAFPSSSGLRIR